MSRDMFRFYQLCVGYAATHELLFQTTRLVRQYNNELCSPNPSQATRYPTMVIVLELYDMTVLVSPLSHIVVTDPKKRGAIVGLQEALEDWKNAGTMD